MLGTSGWNDGFGSMAFPLRWRPRLASGLHYAVMPSQTAEAINPLRYGWDASDRKQAG